MALRSPNVRPRQRARFADEFNEVPYVHIRQRWGNAGYFQARNPDGWNHDLGAQDAFLDNLGIVVRQQIDGTPWGPQYLYTVGFMLRRWALASSLVVHRRPWWGTHFNSGRRRAASGEPRSLFRLLPEDWTRLTRVELESLGAWDMERSGHREVPDDSGDLHLFRDREYREPWRELALGRSDGEGLARWRSYQDWSDEAWAQLFEEPFDRGAIAPEELGSIPEGIAFGALWPDEMRMPVAELRLLHPRHSTPDLPPRVGVTDRDRELYDVILVGRFQAALPTCVAHAVCSGLEVALHRARPHVREVQFSPAHLHMRTGSSIGAGRWIRDAIGFLRDSGLPCKEESLPHQELLEPGFDPNSESIVQLQLDLEGGYLETQFGRPLTRELDVRDVSTIKAHLAAGWVVIVSTRITSGFMDRLRSRTIRDLGLLLSPLPGEAFRDAHAWCLVGYDHVDGATNWKYQGRFVLLNSWGVCLGKDSPYGRGTATMPFAFLLTEGIEAFALRFPGST